MLTTDELEVLEAIKQAWNKFLALPRCHPTEVQEGCTFIHGLQTLVMVRAAVRAHPDLFTKTGEFK